MTAGEGKVYIANVNPGVVRQEFMVSTLQMLLADISRKPQRIGHFVPRLAGPLLSVYRNFCVQHFMDETDDEFLLFLDSDMIVPVDTVDHLLEVCTEDTPVVSGLYFMVLNEGIRPSIFNHQKVDVDGKMEIHLVADETWENDVVVECDAVGAGCLMIHRSLLETMREKYGRPEPWFAQGVWHETIYGEDFTLCMRTKELGFPVLVDSHVRLGHLKTYNLDEHFTSQIDLSPSVSKKEMEQQ